MVIWSEKGGMKTKRTAKEGVVRMVDFRHVGRRVRGVGRKWVVSRQPMLSLDEEPVLHGSGGVKLRAGKAGEL